MLADTRAKAAARAVYTAHRKTLCMFALGIRDHTGRHDRCPWPTQAEVALDPRTQEMFQYEFVGRRLRSLSLNGSPAEAPRGDVAIVSKYLC
jgi:hypothetical protein